MVNGDTVRSDLYRQRAAARGYTVRNGRCEQHAVEAYLREDGDVLLEDVRPEGLAELHAG